MDGPLNRHLERALFATYATEKTLGEMCAEAREQKYFGVSVESSRVWFAREQLEDSEVRVIARVGFPFGAADSDVKRYETEVAADHGAHEIDYAVNLGLFKDGQHELILRELRDAVEAADERPVKAVFEMALMTEEEIALACDVVLDSGARFFCTSSGVLPLVATVKDMTMLCEKLGAQFGIKVAGNIQDAAVAQALIDAGATRIGVNSVL